MNNLGTVEVAALVLGVTLGLCLFAIVMLALASLVKTLRSATSAIEAFSAAAIPLLNDAHDVVRQARSELGTIDTLLGRAESISGTVDSASKLAYSLFSNPAVKALAVASGGARALGRLRKGRRPGARRSARRAVVAGSAGRLGPGAGEAT